MNFYHKNLANGKWFELSLCNQMANIGSEIHRLVKSKGINEERFEKALDRALELIDLTLADKRWRTGYKEIARVREVLCDICFGEGQYDTDLEDLDEYFLKFALVR